MRLQKAIGQLKPARGKKAEPEPEGGKHKACQCTDTCTFILLHFVYFFSHGFCQRQSRADSTDRV